MTARMLLEGFELDDAYVFDDFENYAAIGRPIVFSLGSAEILAEFAIVENSLIAKIAVVDGGGEGVLPVLIKLLEHAARRRGLAAIDWSIFAKNCETPNPKLSKVLEALGFGVRNSNGSIFYWLRCSTNCSVLDRHRA